MKRLAMLLVIVVPLTLLLDAAFKRFGGEDNPEERVQAYVAGTDEHEYVSSEGKFRAMFPGKPGRATESAEIDGKETSIITFAKELGDAEFDVAVYELRPGAPLDLDGVVNGLAVATDARIESSTKLKVQGFEAVEFVAAGRDSTFRKGVLIRAPERVYFVMVVGKENPPPGYDRFKASFQITA